MTISTNNALGHDTEGVVAPRSVVAPATTRNMPAAATAPMHCAATYAGTNLHGNRRVTAAAMLTAGLRWAPEMPPNVATMTATTRPKLSAMPVASGAPRTSWATMAPHPTSTSAKVPTNSASNGLRSGRFTGRLPATLRSIYMTHVIRMTIRHRRRVRKSPTRAAGSHRDAPHGSRGRGAPEPERPTPRRWPPWPRGTARTGSGCRGAPGRLRGGTARRTRGCPPAADPRRCRR